MAAFNRSYGLLAAGLLALELFIARFVHDGLVRPYVGDTLATILVYCLLKTRWRAPAGVAVGVALLISYAIEVGQALHLLAWLGWQHARLARLLLGSQFAWADLLAYTLGAALVLVVEHYRARPAAA
ncbi:ribosomal maturation YjgA family protein [Hymenobacter cheonanensis]|uniref:ribosomal maturation YjgA family protein n=1 Tax=Hymenobacter sp. CA2-7 TaxID=3063993 RepID=UPI0027140CFB|nr:DUF2809 domain-containing protein [Hymenobacter sp. CA2-7]MDO7886273.1 DUF2809 domain-containing protein [Hymenobacter sp. CA2-7]